MDKNKSVSIQPCANYERGLVLESLRRVLEPLGGMGAFVKSGQRAALKANILLGAAPERAITTHPSVVWAAARLVEEAGAKPFIMDSPGSAIPNRVSSLRRVYKSCGLADLGIELNEDVGQGANSIPKGRIVKRIESMSALQKADVIINLPKVKTHSFMFLTCAVKNMFGAIPALLKVGYHSKLKNAERFGGMLLDILDALPPALNIVDGIEGMEGEGPSSGDVKNLGLIFASPDAVLTDLVVSEMIGIDARRVPYLALAIAEGLCPANVAGLQIHSPVPLESLKKTFAPPPTFAAQLPKAPHGTLMKMISPMVNYVFTMRPEVIKKKCIGCGACVRGCPEKIISLQNVDGGKIARIGRMGCIRCFCCHELCPYKAIRLRKSFLYSIINK